MKHIIKDSSYNVIAIFNSQTEALQFHSVWSKKGFTLYYVVEGLL